MKIILLYPDLMGEKSLGVFGQELLQLAEQNPETEFNFMPIINCGGTQPLYEIKKEVTGKGFKNALTYEGKNGLSRVLLRAYDVFDFELGFEDPETIIVRMNPNGHHPISKIIEIATLAQKESCLAIFERELNEKNASPEEILANNQTLPCLYKAMTNGKVCLSNTHGFQAMSVGTLKKIWPHVRNLIPLNNSWGMDAVMALSASVAGVKIIQKSYYLEEKRQRGVEKIEEQLQSHVELLMNARRFFV